MFALSVFSFDGNSNVCSSSAFYLMAIVMFVLAVLFI